jgi:hypothetical protein
VGSEKEVKYTQTENKILMTSGKSKGRKKWGNVGQRSRYRIIKSREVMGSMRT